MAKKKGGHSDTLHLRLDSDLKERIESIADRLHISTAGFVRMAMDEYIARHGPERLRETGTSYGTSPPQTPPDKKLRCAIAAAAVSTSYFVVTRKG